MNNLYYFHELTSIISRVLALPCLEFSSKYANEKLTLFSHTENYSESLQIFFKSSLGDWELVWTTQIRQNGVVTDEPDECKNSGKLPINVEDFTEYSSN